MTFLQQGHCGPLSCRHLRAHSSSAFGPHSRFECGESFSVSSSTLTTFHRLMSVSSNSLKYTAGSKDLCTYVKCNKPGELRKCSKCQCVRRPSRTPRLQNDLIPARCALDSIPTLLRLHHFDALSPFLLELNIVAHDAQAGLVLLPRLPKGRLAGAQEDLQRSFREQRFAGPSFKVGG